MRRVTCTLDTFGFGGEPAPAVQAYWYILRLDRGEWVQFMIDTGSACTALHGTHALALQPHMHLSTLSPLCGIGGSSDYFWEPSYLVFRDDNGRYLSQRVRMGIQQINSQQLSDPNGLFCPNILGRDLINGCIFNYDPTNDVTALLFNK